MALGAVASLACKHFIDAEGYGDLRRPVSCLGWTSIGLYALGDALESAALKG